MSNPDSAVILAAGRGSRMGKETTARPKCLVELAGRPLLEWQINALKSAGITGITAITGYRSELLDTYDEIGTEKNPEWDQSNMVVSLLYAEKFITGPTILSYSDIVYGREAVRAVQEKEGDLVVAYDPNWLSLWKARFDDPLTDAESFVLEGSILKDIGRRCEDYSGIQGQYMGLLKITPAGFGWVRDVLSKHPGERNRLDMTALLQLLISAGRTIETVPVRGAWCEIDTAHDLGVAERMVSNGKLVWPG